MSNILLTGASGFLGGYLKNTLSQSGLLYTLDRQLSDSLYHITTDLSVQKPLLPVRFKQVVHVAGKAHSIPYSTAEKLAFFKVNVQGTQHLLDSLQKVGPPESFIYISTVAVYGCNKGSDICEDQPLQASDLYGKSKVEAETLLQNWCLQYGVRLVILRLPLIAGLQPPGNLGKMIDAIRNNRFWLPGSGQAQKSMVLAEDVANLLPNLFSKNGIFNLTDGAHPSLRQLASAIARSTGKSDPNRLPLIFLKMLAWIGDGIQWILPGPRLLLNTTTLQKLTNTLTFNDDRARSELGWVPKEVIRHPELWIAS